MENSIKDNATLKNTLIIIPVYNSYRYIQKLYQTINNINPTFHVLFINDGSTDHSLDIIRVLEINHLNIPKNKGKGYALKMGLNYAKFNNYKYVITIDSDLQHDPSFINNFFLTQNKENADLVIGFRKFNFKNMPSERVLSNYLTSLIISEKTGTQIIDSQSGFRMYNLSFYDEKRKYSERYQMETEILLHYISQKATIAHTEIPVIYAEEISSISPFRDIVNFIKVIL